MNPEYKKEWQPVRLLKSSMIAANVKSLRFAVPESESFAPGQYYEIRITMPDGFKPDRPFSAANAPEEKGIIEFGIQLIPEGEVSPPLFSLGEGEEVEIRGPYGDDFVWTVDRPGPLYLIGGGSGLVPLMSMLRHHNAHMESDSSREIICLMSAKDQEHLLYKDEIAEISKDNPSIKFVSTFTESAPPQFTGYMRRIDEQMLREVFGDSISKKPTFYICGPTPFVVSITKHLLAIGYDPNNIKTERFGG